jgi:hypothetical protein
MGVRGWLFAVLGVGSLAFGCAEDASSPPSDGNVVAGQGAAGFAAPPVAGAPALTPPTAGSIATPIAGSIAAPVAGAMATPVAGSMAAPVAGAMAPPIAGSAATSPGEWTTLLEEDWNLPAGGEAPQWCGDLMLTEDIYVTAIRPIHPPGTHHTTLSVTDTKTPCSTAAVLQNGIIYAAGVGSETLQLPPGVALKLPKGKVLRLGLHLYNSTDQPLTGTSGVEVIRAAPEDVEHEAELMLAGPLQFSIEPGRHTITHECNVTEAQTVFALFPHMHQLGVHLKTSATLGGQTMVIHDAPYVFEEQYQLPIGPHDLAVGDTITTECTYENTGSENVGFGESSDTEMCFSIFFRYPATGNSLCGR